MVYPPLPYSTPFYENWRMWSRKHPLCVWGGVCIPLGYFGNCSQNTHLANKYQREQATCVGSKAGSDGIALNFRHRNKSGGSGIGRMLLPFFFYYVRSALKFCEITRNKASGKLATTPPHSPKIIVNNFIVIMQYLY